MLNAIPIIFLSPNLFPENVLLNDCEVAFEARLVNILGGKKVDSNLIQQVCNFSRASQSFSNRNWPNSVSFY